MLYNLKVWIEVIMEYGKKCFWLYKYNPFYKFFPFKIIATIGWDAKAHVYMPV